MTRSTQSRDVTPGLSNDPADKFCACMNPSRSLTIAAPTKLTEVIASAAGMFVTVSR
jgi:hypothetical protein